jgi:hypothetical protein
MGAALPLCLIFLNHELVLPVLLISTYYTFRF